MGVRDSSEASETANLPSGSSCKFYSILITPNLKKFVSDTEAGFSPYLYGFFSAHLM
jgi:hypothetical protein